MTFEVEVRGDDLEAALRLLRKKFEKSGLARELKERQYHMTKSQKQKAKDLKAEHRRRQRERRKADR